MKNLIIVLCLFLFPPLFFETYVSAAEGPVDMVYVPSGYSMMGTEYGDLSAENNTKPYHLVYLDAFYIDKYEVTNADYAACTAAGACKEPEGFDSKTRENYYKNITYAHFPVVNVTWQDAADYCAFVEKRLPTEAEWERAARGRDDNRRYPWGNGSPKSYHLNLTEIPGDTERGINYIKGLSPYGAADMLGNVAEWVADWYDESAYQYTDTENPQGPTAGTEKVVRGSSFETDINSLHAAARYGMNPADYAYTLGFRCAKSIHEAASYVTITEDLVSELKPEFFYVKAGNENGIFLIAEPGTGYNTDLIAVVPNGALLEVLVGPVNINYSKWYQVRTQNGETGWTISNSIVSVDHPM
ncbi:MAG: SUMF1/EgtB/PvdO family nonheme iron enzyme [Anaerolineaceae bacterium]|nr:SUMF1/EgtB/PvdO family nonheme iron enzyme [Anaerolineaceae bacterium]